MKAIDLYLFLPGKNEFVNQFSTDSLRKHAADVWGHLDGLSWLLLSVTVIIGIGAAYWYYYPYNNKPGRHYRPGHWLWAGVISAVFCLCLTLGLEYWWITTPLKLTLTMGIFSKVALCNAIYCATVYFIASVVCCNVGHTNAYRLFKI